jgi:glycosyltransferase involved in cell wall biosynthesis
MACRAWAVMVVKIVQVFIFNPCIYGAISNNFLFFVKMYFLSIIIPLYNEETLIAEVVKQVLAVQLPPSVHQFEIVIVDDCSSDQSFNVVTALAAENPLIKVLKHEKNKGKGAAVRTGIGAASGNVFLIQDADLELRPSDIPGMVNCMEELNVEFINGSRYLAGVYRPLSSYKRYLGNRVFTSLTAIIINVKITDMACGYKLIHRNLFEKIELHEDRFGFEAELIIKALRIKKNNIAEMPVRYFPRNEGEGKKFRNSDAIRILFTIIRYGLFKAN